jgi:hypothetical protein
MSEKNEVRGHLCEGLKKFQEYSTYSCIPKFEENGSISGCDATNEVRIIFCPFCGEKLIEVKEYKHTCNDCKETWTSYSEDSHCEECYSSNITTELV